MSVSWLYVLALLFVLLIVCAHWARSDLSAVDAPLSAYFDGASRRWAMAAYAALCGAIAVHGFLTFGSNIRGNVLLAGLYVIAVAAIMLAGLSARTSIPMQEKLVFESPGLHRVAAQVSFLTMLIAMALQTWGARALLDARMAWFFWALWVVAALFFVGTTYTAVLHKGALQKICVLAIIVWLLASVFVLKRGN